MSRAKEENFLMTEGPIQRRILRYAVPVFIGFLFQQLYNTADALIVGNLIGSKALAAVTGTGTIVFMAVGFFMGFSIGAGIAIAKYIGAEDDENTFRSVHTSAAIGLAFCLILSVAGVLLSPAVLRLMETPSDVIDDAALYLRIFFAGSSGLILYNTFVGVLQASGDSKHPLYYLIISSVTNVVLDVVFIALFRMGVDGAALATVIAQCLSAFLVFLRLHRRTDSIRLRVRKIRFYWSNFGEIVRYGLPTALQNCMIDFANMMIQSYINSFSSAAMAGMGAYSKIEGFAFLPVNSFSMALSTFVSQNRGAGKKDRIRKGITSGLLWAVAIVEVIGAVLFLFSPTLLAAFNRDPDVIAIGVLRSDICSLFFCLLAFTHVSSAILRGLGRPVAPMVVMMVCWCAVRVIVLTTIGRMYHDILLACWIYPVTWTLSSIVDALYLYRLKRKGVF